MTNPNEQPLRADLVADARHRAGMPPADDGQQQHEFSEAEIDVARAVDVERERATQIIRLCGRANRNDLAGDLILSGSSVRDAARLLDRAQRAAPGASRT